MQHFGKTAPPAQMLTMVADPRKKFFSEEKNQKTLASAVADLSCGTNT
jgi:hypothetical protein